MRMQFLLVLFLFLFSSCATYYTPQQFGAKADGVTDCTSAIQSMLSSMKQDNIQMAKFPDGDYLISDGFVIDFPCLLKGKHATILTKDTLKCKYAFKFSKSKKGDFEENKNKTEVSLNFRIHGVPLAFHGFNNLYVHDCTISTFTGTDIYYKNTKFWFAIDCDRMHDARFSNIYFDQPVNYRKNEFNSADGLHITGQCHDILIDNCYGHCGDDFIALNANEDTPGDISNIVIRNCNIGSDTISKNGIRIYGAAKLRNLTISNILIKDCKITPSNSPCVYITNSPNGVNDSLYNRIVVKNLTIKDCVFNAPKYELASGDHPSIIRLAGVEGDSIIIKNIKAFAHGDSISYFVNILQNNDLRNVSIQNNYFRGENASSFVQSSFDSFKFNMRSNRVNNIKIK